MWALKMRVAAQHLFATSSSFSHSTETQVFRRRQTRSKLRSPNGFNCVWTQLRKLVYLMRELGPRIMKACISKVS